MCQLLLAPLAFSSFLLDCYITEILTQNVLPRRNMRYAQSIFEAHKRKRAKEGARSADAAPSQGAFAAPVRPAAFNKDGRLHARRALAGSIKERDMEAQKRAALALAKARTMKPRPTLAWVPLPSFDPTVSL